MSELNTLYQQLIDNPVLLAIFIILSTMILEDPSTIATGVLWAKGDISLGFAFATITLGVFLGDLFLYLIGRGIAKGISYFKRPLVVPVSVTLISLARFVPGMRTITFTSAGVSEYPLILFVLITLPSSIIWTGFILLFSTQVKVFFNHYPHWLIYSVLASFIVILLLLEKGVKRKMLLKRKV